MKPPYDWNEEDILQLISNQVEENLHLDYKATASLQKADSKKIEISKDVSAFANSAGGTIIYGVSQFKEADRRQFPERVDGGYDPNELSKEWLEQVINSRIQPRIGGIRIRPIPLEKTFPGKVVYVASIPESYTAHQASDHRYYKRFNFESVAMEDYEVRLVINKIRYPLLFPNFEYKSITRSQEQHIYRLMVGLTNNGMVRAIDIQFHLWWPVEVPIQSRGIELRDLGEERVSERQFQHFVVEFFGSKRVIFPKQRYNLIPPDAGPFHLEYSFDNNVYRRVRDLKLQWQLFASDAPLQEGEESFERLNNF